jgi:cytochrome b subunit of formate dehydrogenase
MPAREAIRAVGPRGRRVYWLLFVFILFISSAWAAKKPSNADCLACHGDATLTHEINGKPVSLGVDEKKFNASIHGAILTCVDCHDDLKSAPHETAPAKVSCAKCHADADKAYSHSVHAEALKAKSNGSAPTCIACHGGPHEILPPSDPKSKVAHANIPATCGACHGQKFVMEQSGLSSATFINYEESVHGKAVAAGSTKAAVCTDCHGSHEILPPKDPKSRIYQLNVPETCAQCHNNVKQEFMQSIHGQAVARGNFEAPVCTDCHGIHTIKSHLDPKSSVFAGNIARATCANCHEGMRMSQEYGFSGRRMTTYTASYHGLAAKLGSTVVANCASCHGAHNILPSSDPRSMINKANLVKTCGQCHPGATQRFTLGKVHVDVPLSADVSSKAIRWIRGLYIPLIIVVIGGMVLHNFLIWRKKTVAKRNAQHRSVIRMTLGDRVQHAALLSSFITLAITGFALAYPDSWLGLVFGEKLRRYGHRVAAVVMIAVGLYNLYFMTCTRRGRQVLKDILPRLKDGFDIRDNLGYYLGLGSRRPAFARFNYAEKAEYWALVWGYIIMGVTGLMAWFKMGVGHWLPRWSVDVALAIHFYEAVLATLAIVVWHFYQVIFDPDVYPLNWAFWDGKMPEELYHEEHPLDALREMEGRVNATAASPSLAASAPGDGSAADDRHQREVEAKWKGNK